MEALLKAQTESDQMDAVVVDKAERRRSRRLRLPSHLPVRVGRRNGILVDLSSRGARVRHSGSLELGSEVRLSFESGEERFTAVARVLASRVIGFGTADGTSFESRISFGDLSEEMVDLVKRLLAGT